MRLSVLGALVTASCLVALSADAQEFKRGMWVVERKSDTFSGSVVCEFKYHDPANPERRVSWDNNFMQITGFGPLAEAEFKINGGPIRKVSAFDYFGQRRRYVETLNQLGVVLLSGEQVEGAASVAVRANGTVAEVSLVDFVAVRDDANAAGCPTLVAAR